MRRPAVASWRRGRPRGRGTTLARRHPAPRAAGRRPTTARNGAWYVASQPRGSPAGPAAGHPAPHGRAAGARGTGSAVGGAGSVPGVDRERVLDAFAAESARLADAVGDLPEDAWQRPTECAPWRVRELFAHIIVATGRVPEALAAAPPDRAEITAAEYYRPDERFADGTNAARITLAQREAAARGGGAELVADFTAAWRRAVSMCREQPHDRVVRSRHGDAMLLTEFLVTRVVEVAVHGLDVAAALERRPWLTPPAGDVLAGLFLPPGTADGVRALGWDRPAFARKISGREPLSPAERRRLDELGVRLPALG